MSEKQPSLQKNFILSTLYEILCVIAPFITAPYAARVLGPANTGIYSYTHSYVMYFTLIASLGTAQYGKREISRTRDDRKLCSKLFWEIELLSIVTSCVALLGWGIFVFFATQYKLYFIILTLFILAKMFDITWFFTGQEQFKYTVTRNTIVKITGIVCLYTFVKTPEDLWIYFLFHAGVDFLGSLSMWISLPRFLVPVDRKTLTIRPHFKETLVYFIPTVATSIYTILDKTLIGLITHEETENGFYEQATKIIHVVRAFAFSAVNSVLGARTSYLFEQKKTDEIKDKIHNSIDFILFMSIGCCLGLVGIASNFVPLFYGPGYEPVILIMQLLSPILIITGISTNLNDLYFTPGGYKKKSAIYVITGAITNLICNLLFIPRLNALGAVIGTLIAESVIMLLYLFNCNRFLTVRHILQAAWKKIIAGLVMLLFLCVVKRQIHNALLLLLVQIGGGASLYICVLLLLKDKLPYTLISKIMLKLKKKK
ncbi:MAG: flippase [Treponema sp.]|nr:flippase [Candidatus Treponema caballi]